MMNCEKCREKLILLIERELGDNDSQELKLHLDDCPECRAVYQDLLQTTRILKQVNRSHCPQPQELTTFLENTQQQEIELHLQTCPFCRQELDLLQAESRINAPDPKTSYHSQKLPESLSKIINPQKSAPSKWQDTFHRLFSKPVLAFAGFLMIFVVTLLTLQYTITQHNREIVLQPETAITAPSQATLPRPADLLKTTDETTKVIIAITPSPVKTVKTAEKKAEKYEVKIAPAPRQKVSSPAKGKSGAKTKAETLRTVKPPSPSAPQTLGKEDKAITAPTTVAKEEKPEKDQETTANAAYPQAQSCDNYAGQAQVSPTLRSNEGSSRLEKAPLEEAKAEADLPLAKIQTAIKKLLDLTYLEVKTEQRTLVIVTKQELSPAEKTKVREMLRKNFPVKTEQIVFKVEK